MKRIFSIALIAAMMLTVFSVSALADDSSETTSAAAVHAGESRVVMGADLSEEQRTSVYAMFGINEGSVTELTVTNSEERSYLEGIVNDDKIGTNSISCIYIKLLDSDSGLTVKVNNINWCTEDIYKNALMTAGIYDADVIVAAPFEVSGTAALTGIYKAYEDITGTALDASAKQAAVSELVTTSEIAQEVGDADATTIVNQLKAILDQTAQMSDDELKTQIQNFASQDNITLTDDQIAQLISLVRQLEKMDTSELVAKVQGLQNIIKSVSSTSSNVTKFFQSVGSFFSKIGDFFAGLFGK